MLDRGRVRCVVYRRRLVAQSKLALEVVVGNAAHTSSQQAGRPISLGAAMALGASVNGCEPCWHNSQGTRPVNHSHLTRCIASGRVVAQNQSSRDVINGYAESKEKRK